jgi:hypothetical protein
VSRRLHLLVPDGARGGDGSPGHGENSPAQEDPKGHRIRVMLVR